MISPLKKSMDVILLVASVFTRRLGVNSAEVMKFGKQTKSHPAASGMAFPIGIGENLIFKHYCFKRMNDSVRCLNVMV